MGAISTPLPVKLIVGILSTGREVLSEAVLRLKIAYGPIDLVGDVMDFDFTHYYDEQMGSPLLRQFVAFDELIDPGTIVAIKRATNEVEDDFTSPRPGLPKPALRRAVNLDPGYITESKLILASTKDFAHRIYLGEGIYAEVTLTYVHGRWVSHPYTFPDYASGLYDAFLTRARDALRAQLKQMRCSQ